MAMSRAKKQLTIGYADFETTNYLDLEAEGYELRVIGNELFVFREGFNCGAPKVSVKCAGLIVKTPEGKCIERMYHSVKELLEGLLEFNVDRCYFHNLKFDDSFIASYMRDDVIELGEWKVKSIKRTINNKGMVYEDLLEYTGPRDEQKHRAPKHRCAIWDSAKIWNTTLRKLGEDFGVYKKGEGHEEALRVGCDARMEEYCLQDCRVMMTAMEYYFKKCSEETGGQRPYGWMTAASTAYNLASMDMIGILGTKEFNNHFPPCDEEHGFPQYLREGYKGAVPLLDKAIKNTVLRDVMVFDVNSMYPTQLHNSPLPMGKPIPLDGADMDRLMRIKERGKLWVAMVKMKMHVKKGHRATYMLKRKNMEGDTLADNVNDYEGTFADKESFQVITSVDMDYILRDYDIEYIEVLKAVGFEADVDRQDLFFGNMVKGNALSHFVGRWYAIKEQASKDKDKSLKAFAKLILNALYGKFGANPEHVSAEYVFEGDDMDMIRVRECDEVEIEKAPKYLPLAMFTTSYARNMISNLCNVVGWDHVAYTDTDSIHCYGLSVDECVNRIKEAGYCVDGNDLGALKFESRWEYAIYVRNKGYFHFGELDPYTGKALGGKEIKLAGANGFSNFNEVADVFDEELTVEQTRGYRVCGGTMLYEHDTTVDTRLDAGMKTIKKIKGMNTENSMKEIARRENAIFAMMGVN